MNVRAKCEARPMEVDPKIMTDSRALSTAAAWTTQWCNKLLHHCRDRVWTIASKLSIVPDGVES